jgi:hypothetical protein
VTPIALTPTGHDQPRAPRRGSRWLRTLAGASAVAAVIFLAGCAAVPGTISAEISEQLQNDVVALAESAAAGDIAGATNALAIAETRLNEGLAADTIDAERGAAIQKTIDLVRADLVAMTTPVEETPAPVDTPEPVATTPVEEVPDPEPSTVAPPEPTPVESPQKGPGNDNGNGNSNGNTPGAGNGPGNGPGNAPSSGTSDEPDENEPDEDEPAETE